jgi:hypothetical protein
VAELNGLFDRLKGAGGVCRSAELREHPGDECEYEYSSEYCEAGDGVGAAFENLGHTGLPGAHNRVVQLPESSGRMECRYPIGSKSGAN